MIFKQGNEFSTLFNHFLTFEVGFTPSRLANTLYEMISAMETRSPPRKLDEPTWEFNFRITDAFSFELPRNSVPIIASSQLSI